MAAARRNVKQTTPQKQRQKPSRNNNSEEARRLAQRLRNRTGNLGLTTRAAPTSSSAPPGVASAQYNQYQNYLNSCVTPIVFDLWDQVGPSGMAEGSRMPVVTFTVSPTGGVISCIVSSKSDNPALTSAAEQLARQLKRKRFPPFSQVGLSTINHAALTFKFNLVCEQQ